MRLEVQGPLTIDDLRRGLRLAWRNQQERLARRGQRGGPRLLLLALFLLFVAALLGLAHSWGAVPLALLAVFLLFPWRLSLLYGLYVRLPRIYSRSPEKFRLHLLLDDEGVQDRTSAPPTWRAWAEFDGYAEDEHGFVLGFEPEPPDTGRRVAAPPLVLYAIPRHFLPDAEAGELRAFLTRRFTLRQRDEPSRPEPPPRTKDITSRPGPVGRGGEPRREVTGRPAPAPGVSLSDTAAGGPGEEVRVAKPWTQDLGQVTLAGWALIVCSVGVGIGGPAALVACVPNGEQLLQDNRWMMAVCGAGLVLTWGCFQLGKRLLARLGLRFTRLD